MFLACNTMQFEKESPTSCNEIHIKVICCSAIPCYIFIASHYRIGVTIETLNKVILLFILFMLLEDNKSTQSCLEDHKMWNVG